MMDQPWGYAAHGEDLAEGGQGEFPMQPICRGPADLDYRTPDQAERQAANLA